MKLLFKMLKYIDWNLKARENDLERTLIPTWNFEDGILYFTSSSHFTHDYDKVYYMRISSKKIG